MPRWAGVKSAGQRTWRVVVVSALALTLAVVPASAAPTSPLCDDGSYRKAHPLICDTGEPGPFNVGGGGGGGSGGGLIGVIGGLLGGLTGGLL